MDKIPEVITVNDNSTKINNDIISLIKNELAPIHDFQMELFSQITKRNQQNNYLYICQTQKSSSHLAKTL